MKKLSLALVAGSVVACAPSAPATAPAPASLPTVVLKESPVNWHLPDETIDRVAVMSLLRAQRELLAGKQPKRNVLVAVIDNGVDTAHADLRPNLWLNERELVRLTDDDRNGYMDDHRGWNFIGGRDGRNVNQDTFEVTRLYVRC